MTQQKINVALVLAAGSSSRMGKPKQLLSVGSESLIRKTVKEVTASGVDKIFVVLGFDNESIEKEITDLPVEIIFNPDWEKGMGNSIKYGLSYAMKIFQPETIIFTVSDQPLLTSAHLKNLLREYLKTKSPIVASRYSDSDGVPALFHQLMFERLLSIDDKSGAKKIIEQNSALVKSVDFPEGAVDLDTPEDYEKFKKDGLVN